MASNFRVELAKEEDVQEIATLTVPSFAHYPIEVLCGNIDTAEAISAAAGRHLRAWNEHIDETGFQPAIKCVHTDPVSGEETIAACAQWWIFEKPRIDPEKWNYLLTADWLPEGSKEREKAQDSYRPVAENRVKWTRGRGHAILQYMCTNSRFRRRGAATMCVKWGLERCREFSIPAYLEASEDGKPVYEKLGYEVMEDLTMVMDGEQETFPIMMWWPPGTKPEDKRPLAV